MTADTDPVTVNGLDDQGRPSRRILFEGTFAAARQFMETNFPRPGHDGNGGLIHSAVIVHADGGVSKLQTGDPEPWTHPEIELDTEPDTEPVEASPVVEV